MRILLVSPPVRDFYESAERLAPVGLASLKAALGKWMPEAEAKILDARAGHSRRTVPLPPELAFLRDYYRIRDTGPFSTFAGYYHFGADYGHIAGEAHAFAPDLVGISCLFSAYCAEAIETARAIKMRLPGVPVVFGGPHASASPESVLGSGFVDYVIRGEGERPLAELAKALYSGAGAGSAPNLAWLESGRLQSNPQAPNYPIEELPPPDYSDLDPDLYRIGRRRLATVVTSRGCPHSCDFCSAREVFGTVHRRRPAASIIAEMGRMVAEGYSAFDFEDDNLTTPPAAFHELLEAIIAEFGERALHFSAMNGVNYQTLDAPTLSLMRRAGFNHLNLSLVSADEGLCRAHGRIGSREKFSKVARLAADMGFLTTAYLILGLPGEPLESMLDGLAFLAGLPVLIGVSPFYLTPGMALWSGEATRERLMRARLAALGPDTPGCSRRDVYTLFISARIINFLKGLDAQDGASLGEAIGRAAALGGRLAAGAELLQKLLETGVLRSWSGGISLELEKFDGDLFTRLRRRIGRLENRRGDAILLA